MATSDIVDATADTKNKFVFIKWSGESDADKYPFVWLRDNCQCHECLEPTSMNRLLLLANLDVDVEAKSLKWETKSLNVEWNNGHVSKYSSSWLFKHSFQSDRRKEHAFWHRLPPNIWRAEMQNNIPSVIYDDIMHDDGKLLDFIIQVEQVGLCIIRDAPSRSGVLKEFGNRIGFLRTTSYGETFTVTARVNPSNAAYTNAELGLHTDQPYLDHVPRVQLLHCIKQAKTEGGENQFSDGFSVAERFKKEYPDYYKLLSTVPVEFNDVGVDFVKFCSLFAHPTIELGLNGQVNAINFNNQVRDSYFNVPAEEVHEFYKAMSTFNKLLYDKEFLITHKLSPGEIVIFNNRRVLHGRSHFKVVESGERHLEGAYMEYDQLTSRGCVILMEKKMAGYFYRFNDQEEI